MYSGFCEAIDEAVVCCECGGMGWKMIKVYEFVSRKKLRGIKRIKTGGGKLFVLKKDPGHLTYKQFEEKFKSDKELEKLIKRDGSIFVGSAVVR